MMSAILACSIHAADIVTSGTGQQPAEVSDRETKACETKKPAHQLTYEEARQLREMQGELNRMHDETMDDRYRH